MYKRCTTDTHNDKQEVKARTDTHTGVNLAVMPLKHLDLPLQTTQSNLIKGAGLSKGTAGWLLLLLRAVGEESPSNTR